MIGFKLSMPVNRLSVQSVIEFYSNILCNLPTYSLFVILFNLMKNIYPNYLQWELFQSLYPAPDLKNKRSWKNLNANYRFSDAREKTFKSPKNRLLNLLKSDFFQKKSKSLTNFRWFFRRKEKFSPMFVSKWREG